MTSLSACAVLGVVVLLLCGGGRPIAAEEVCWPTVCFVGCHVVLLFGGVLY